MQKTNAYNLGYAVGKQADWLDSAVNSAGDLGHGVGQGLDAFSNMHGLSGLNPWASHPGQVSPPIDDAATNLYGQSHSPGLQAEQLGHDRGVDPAVMEQVQQYMRTMHNHKVPADITAGYGQDMMSNAPGHLPPAPSESAPAAPHDLAAGAAHPQSTTQTPTMANGGQSAGQMMAGMLPSMEQMGKMWDNPNVRYPALIGGGALGAYALGKMLGGKKEEKQPQMPMMYPGMMDRGRSATFNF